jgi:hypothetical protein
MILIASYDIKTKAKPKANRIPFFTPFNTAVIGLLKFLALLLFKILAIDFA